MIDITVNIEPLTRSGVNPVTGAFETCRIDGWEGSIIIVQQAQLMGLPNLLEWGHIHGQTMQDVARRQLIMLNSLKADIEKMIEKIEKPLNEGRMSERRDNE